MPWYIFLLSCFERLYSLHNWHANVKQITKWTLDSGAPDAENILVFWWGCRKPEIQNDKVEFNWRRPGLLIRPRGSSTVACVRHRGRCCYWCRHCRWRTPSSPFAFAWLRRLHPKMRPCFWQGATKMSACIMLRQRYCEDMSFVETREPLISLDVVLSCVSNGKIIEHIWSHFELQQKWRPWEWEQIRARSHRTQSTSQQVYICKLWDTVVNRSVHTGCKQHQRVCRQICMQICLRVLCEQDLRMCFESFAFLHGKLTKQAHCTQIARNSLPGSNETSRNGDFAGLRVRL